MEVFIKKLRMQFLSFISFLLIEHLLKMKSGLLSCLFFFLAASTSLAQIRKVDSVLNQYNKCKIDTAKIDVLLDNSGFLIDADSKRLVDYAEAALKIAKKIDDKKRQSALLCLLSQGYEQIGKIAEAIGYIDENIKVATQINNPKDLGMAKMNLGVCYNEIGHYSLSIKYYEQCLEFFSKTKDSLSICISYIALSDAYFKTNHPDSAIFHLKLAEKVSLLQNNYLLDYIYTNYAESYYLKKEYDLAKEYAFKGIAISEPTNNLYALAAEYLVMAKISLAANDFSNATMYVQKGLKLAEETDFKENLINAYDIYSQLLEKESKFAEALKYKSLYIDAKLKLETSLNLNILQAYENVKRDEELAEIIAKDLNKDAVLKSDRFTIIIITLVLLMVICIALLFYYSRNKFKASNLELIQKNEQISLQAENIRELSSIKDRLFSIVSHDLRSPLINLKGILALLVKGSLSQEKFQMVVPQLNKGVNTTLDLLENLLHWSKSQLKGFVVTPSHFDIHTLAETELNLFEKVSAEKGITITNNIPANTLAFADKNMIDVVLRNLVANAIKFCKYDGKVTVDSEVTEGQVRVTVADNGVGISEENVKKIFSIDKVFTTLGTNKEKGTGLGLLLCKEFVEKNNGTIGVESTLNEGSKFWFTLPVA